MARSASNIAAVIVLSAVAVSAAVLVFLWTLHLLWLLHVPPAQAREVVEVISANVTGSGGGELIGAEVLDPQGSISTSVVALQLVALNGTVLCTTTHLSAGPSNGTVTSVALTPGQYAVIYGYCPGLHLGVGLQARVVVITSTGYEASKGVVVG